MFAREFTVGVAAAPPTTGALLLLLRLRSRGKEASGVCL